MLRLFLFIFILSLNSCGLFFPKTYKFQSSELKKQNIRINQKTGKIVAFGDSLTYGQGAESGKRYTDHLSKLFDEKVINLGFPGITSYQAKDKINLILSHKPRTVFITLGGNDVLKNRPVTETIASLSLLFDELNKNQINTVFLGLSHLRTQKHFAQIRELCLKKKVLYLPHIMRGFWGNKELMNDAIHPNEKGQKILAERVFEAWSFILDSHL